MAKQTFTTGQVLTAAQMTSLQQTAMGGGSPVTKTASYVLVAADAGTVIQMNSASSTTITVNTSLFAAGDSVQIQNIGAGVCTITAGTATVTTAGSLALSQWEGGTLYFTSTSASIFFDIVQSSGMTNPMTTTGDTIYSSSGSTPARLGIGSTGQVLTVSGGVPTWATASSSSKVLQVVQGTTTTSTTISSTTYTDTTLSASITPTASTSKILILITQDVTGGSSTDQGGGPIRIMRGSTSIWEPTSDTSVTWLKTSASTPRLGIMIPVTYLDSPSTTSSTTYKTQGKVQSATNSMFVGYNGQAVSTITLLEIGA